MDNIVDAVNKAGSFLLVMHVDPDGDTIGSCSAFAQALRKMGKSAVIFSGGPVPEIYRFLKGTENVISELNDDMRFDATVAFDCSTITRIKGGEEIKKYSPLLINVDHHEDNSRFGAINYVRKASSTGEIVYQLLRKFKAEFDADIAASLYTAIVTDTGSFRYGNTTASVFKIVSDLVKHGADPHDIATRIYEAKTISEIKILGKALGSLETVLDGSIAWILLSKEDIDSSGVTNEEINGIVDHLRSIKTVDVAFLVRELGDGKVKVNLRSKTKNIQKIARLLGGGGHPRASGAVLAGGLEDTRDRIITSVKELWTEL